MRELIVRYDRELRRLNQAIAAFDARPCADRVRMRHLLSALMAERDEIERSARRAKPAGLLGSSVPQAAA
jgi:hypothetical protein